MLGLEQAAVPDDLISVLRLRLRKLRSKGRWIHGHHLRLHRLPGSDVAIHRGDASHHRMRRHAALSRHDIPERRVLAVHLRTLHCPA